MRIGFRVGPPDRPDHYRLVRPLGSGGEGQVWEAEERISDAGWVRVAVKMHDWSGTAADSAAWARYGALLRSMPAIPGLVGIREIFVGAAPYLPDDLRTDVDGPAPSVPPGPPRRYVVMRFVNGRSFDTWSAGVPTAERLRALQPVAAALDALHAGTSMQQHGRDVVVPLAHGDVKPQNVVVDRDGLGVLVDLGSTMVTGDNRRPGRTRLYAAPELRQGGSPTPGTDRYAFVATVAWAVLGRLPADPHGHLDLPALDRDLAADPFCAARPEIRRMLLGALHGDRPWPLGDWLELLSRRSSARPSEQAGGPAGPAHRAPGPSEQGRGPAGQARRAPGPVAPGPRVGGRRLLPAALLTGAAAVLATAVILFGDRTPEADALDPAPGISSSTGPSAEAGISGPPPSAQGSADPGTPTAGPPPPGEPPEVVTTTTSTRPRTTVEPAGPGPDVERRSEVTLSATMSCSPSCTTSEKLLSLGGSLTGSLAPGHQLMLFVLAPDGRHYPGSKGLVSDGRWTGKVHVGSDNGTEPAYTYRACAYDIDRVFADDLAGRSADDLNQGLTEVPTEGSARELACRGLTWQRP